jgi:hypothetical protein
MFSATLSSLSSLDSSEDDTPLHDHPAASATSPDPSESEGSEKEIARLDTTAGSASSSDSSESGVCESGNPPRRRKERNPPASININPAFMSKKRNLGHHQDYPLNSKTERKRKWHSPSPSRGRCLSSRQRRGSRTSSINSSSPTPKFPIGPAKRRRIPNPTRKNEKIQTISDSRGEKMRAMQCGKWLTSPADKTPLELAETPWEMRDYLNLKHRGFEKG